MSKIKFRTGYNIDLGGKMHEVHPGDVAEVSADRAQKWIERGVAEAV